PGGRLAARPGRRPLPRARLTMAGLKPTPAACLDQHDLLGPLGVFLLLCCDRLLRSNLARLGDRSLLGSGLALLGSRRRTLLGRRLGGSLALPGQRRLARRSPALSGPSGLPRRSRSLSHSPSSLVAERSIDERCEIREDSFIYATKRLSPPSADRPGGNPSPTHYWRRDRLLLAASRATECAPLQACPRRTRIPGNSSRAGLRRWPWRVRTS